MNIGQNWRLGWPDRATLAGYRLGQLAMPGNVFEDHVLSPSEVKATSTWIPRIGLDALVFLSDRLVDVSVGTAGINEVHTLILGGGTLPTAGTVAIGYAAGATGPIDWNADAAAVQAAYEAASWIGPGDVSVTGGPMPGSTVYVEFTGALASTNVAASTPPHTYSMSWDGSPILADTLTDGEAGASTPLLTLLGQAHPVIWHADYNDDFPCPITSAVSGLTLTNLSAVHFARVRIFAYYDQGAT